MEYRDLDLVCPACRGDLRSHGAAALECTSCSRAYPVLAGIADLRLWPDPYIGIEEDREKGLKLSNACAGLSFADSVELYYRLTTVVPPFQAKAFTRALLSAVPRAAHSLERWRAEHALLASVSNGSADRRSGAEQPDGADAAFLEVGCGTAALLVAASGSYEQVAGVDVAFRWLVLARKRLEESGLEVPLVCACAEALPFADARFTHVVFDSTIENVRDQAAALNEAHRVLRIGGRVSLGTPNRLSLGPDPHAGIWAGGWMPDGALAWWVRRRGGIPPKRRLLSRGGVQRALAGAGFERTRIFVPHVPAAQRDGFGAALRRIIDGYNAATRTAVGRALLLRIGPLLHAVARKPAGTRRTPRD
jgi:SAM-dependent methyltransferase/uncharacterized protein YbaR (Trm112 family)